jgi:hypothetical protein
VKLKLNLSLTPNRAQRYAQPVNTEIQLLNAPAPSAATCNPRHDSPFALLTVRSKKPVRIPPPIVSTRPILRGSKPYLRALRSAEMAIWNANIKFPMFSLVCLTTIVLPFAV